MGGTIVPAAPVSMDRLAGKEPTMKKLVMIAGVMSVVLGGLLVAGPSPASADAQCVVHDRGNEVGKTDTACLSEDHRTLKVCDGEKGNRVEAWVWWPSGPLAFTDENGSKPPCSFYKLPRGAYGLALCENNWGCEPGRGEYIEA
jgi:hypothetical protein